MRASRRQSGQTMVEFALVSLLLMIVVLAIMDFGYFFAGHVSATNSARGAARYAATHPVNWTNSSNPNVNTIEGRLVLIAVPAVVINDDSHITISYVVPGLAAGTTCGQYSAASNSFVPVTGYTQATCIVAGDLVTVKATYVYHFITPMLASTFAPGTLTISTEATELIEVTPS